MENLEQSLNYKFMARRTKERRFRINHAVLGEGITEQWYLRHLKDHNGYTYSIRPSLFADVGIEKAEGIIDELVSGGCDSIIFLTDYDTIVAQNKKAEFDKLVQKYKDDEEVLICDSMPSIEYWFLLHFKYSTKLYATSDEVIKDLKNYIKVYSKKGKDLKTCAWFSKLVENDGIEKAIANAKKGLSKKEQEDVGKHFPFTKMHLAIEAFEKQKI